METVKEYVQSLLMEPLRKVSPGADLTKVAASYAVVLTEVLKEFPLNCWLSIAGVVHVLLSLISSGENDLVIGLREVLLKSVRKMKAASLGGQRI